MNMHVDEKTDSVVVLMKPSNKGEDSLAEVVEGRTLPEGNSDQMAAVRTQSRVMRRTVWWLCAERENTMWIRGA